MFRVFQNLNTHTNRFFNDTEAGLAKGQYKNEQLVAVSYKEDNNVITKLFSEKYLLDKKILTDRVFTWDSDVMQSLNTLDLSLMCYQRYNITKPKLSDMLKKYINQVYDNEQVQTLKRLIKNDNLIPYYITVADLCRQSEVYLELGQNLYSQFSEQDKQFYCHLLKAKKTLKKIRTNQIVINKDILLNYLKSADNKYQKIGNQILKRLQNQKLTQYLDITGTVTGRVVGTKGLNLQTLPKKVGLKRCIESRFKDGLIVVVDWNAMEFRIALAEAEHTDLTKTDIHTQTAQQLFQKENITVDEREQAKIINFSIIYSGFANKNADIIEKLYPALNNKVQSVIEEARRVKKQINIFGRKRIFSNDTLFQTKAFNNLIQGTAADICLRALYLIQDNIEEQQLKSRIILAVHDSIVFDCQNDELPALLDIIQDIMTDKAIPTTYKQRLLFPVTVEVGNNYEDLVDIATIYKNEV